MKDYAHEVRENPYAEQLAVISGMTMSKSTVPMPDCEQPLDCVFTQTRRSRWRDTRLRLLLLLLFAFASGPVHAQEDVTFQPASGDAWIDRHLADMNDYAARYPQSFVDEVSRYYSVPREYVEALLQQPGWEPGDVFMACALGRILAQPCRKVVREWSRDHVEGWRNVASRMKSRPDQPVTQELRKNIRESYGRWARPLMK
jgi:hypothetical protein